MDSKREKERSIINQLCGAGKKKEAREREREFLLFWSVFVTLTVLFATLEAL